VVERKFILTLLVVGTLLTGASRADSTAWLWHPYNTPNRPVVRTSDDAILFAYAMWRAMAPDSQPVAETSWKARFEASLVDGVWRVRLRTPSPEQPSLGFYIGAQDARYLGAFDPATPQ